MSSMEKDAQTSGAEVNKVSETTGVEINNIVTTSGADVNQPINSDGNKNTNTSSKKTISDEDTNKFSGEPLPMGGLPGGHGGGIVPTSSASALTDPREVVGGGNPAPSLEGGGGGAKGPFLDQSSDLQYLEEDVKKKQKKEEMDKALVDVYLSWSEETETAIESHRTLQRHESDLISLNTVMKSYAYSVEENDPDVVNAVYEYIHNAQEVYLRSLMLWLQENDKDGLKKANPATPRIKVLLDNLHVKLKPKLDRYYGKALKCPEERSERSVSTNSSRTSLSRKSTRHTVSETSREILSRMERDHKKALADMESRYVTLKIAHDEMLQNQVKVSNDEAKLKSQLIAVQDAAAQEKRDLMQRHMEEKQELMRDESKAKQHSLDMERQYGLLQQEMRVTRDRIYLQKQAEIDQINKDKRTLELETATTLKKLEIKLKDKDIEHKSQIAVLNEDLKKARTQVESHNFPAAEDLELINGDTEETAKTQFSGICKSNTNIGINVTAPPFVPRVQAGTQGDPTCYAPGTCINSALQHGLYRHTVSQHPDNFEKPVYTQTPGALPVLKSSMEWPGGYTATATMAHTEVNLGASTSAFKRSYQPALGGFYNQNSPLLPDVPWMGGNYRSSTGVKKTLAGDDVNKNSSKLPWENYVSTSASQPTPGGWNNAGDSFYENEYIKGRLDGRLNEKYMAMFQAGRHETERKFDGKLDNYPMFRQELQQHYELLWQSEPRTLLKKIASSVTDNVWKYIKSAWVERNPWESLNMIWDILEDEYGDPRLLLNHSVRQVLMESKGVSNTIASLTSFRAKLRNLKAVAGSINKEDELKKPKLLIKITDLLSTELRNKFEVTNPNPKMWSFQCILEFINTQVDVLRFRQRHLKDVSSIMIDLEEQGSGKKKSAIKANSVRQVDKEQTVEGNVRRESAQSHQQLPFCDFHPSSKSHVTKDCRKFLEMRSKERQGHVKKHHRCYLCIGPHWRRDCPEISTAKCETCNGSHHTLLHLSQEDKKKSSANKSKDSSKEKSNTPKTETVRTPVTVNIVGASERQLDEVATVPIMALEAVQYDNGRVKKIVPFYALLDTGAERTLCTKYLAKKLYGWDPSDTSQLQFLEGEPKTYSCMKMPLQLKLASSSNVIPMREVIFLDTKLPYSESIPDREILETHQASNAKFPVITGNRRIDMIMGAPHINEFGIFFNTKWSEMSPGGPRVGLNQLGEIWWGLKEDEKTTPYIRIVRCLPASDVPLIEPHIQSQIKKMVEETHGINSKESSSYMPSICEEVKKYTLDPMILEYNYADKCPSKDDEKVHQFYLENVEEVTDYDGQRRIQLPLPWKYGPIDKPGSRWKAESSLRSLWRRLEKQPENMKKYKQKHAAMLAENHLERVPDEEIDPGPGHPPVNYLTHHHTHQVKFRVVFNGALKIGKDSINDMLYRGPMFNESLVSILIRFREFKYAVTGDIKSMYFQILVHPKDRDMLRVVFYDENGVLQHYRFRVMPWGLTPIASIAGFCRNYTAERNYSKSPDWIVDLFKKSMYVDDLCRSCPTLHEAKQIVDASRRSLQTFGFHIGKWLSSHPEVLEEVPEEDLAPGAKDFSPDDGENPTYRTLGIAWTPMTDGDMMKLRCLTGKSPQDGVLTQRNSLRQLNSHFDPLGLWAPFFLKLKWLYSQIAKCVDSWDEIVPQEMSRKWNDAMDDLKRIQDVKFPRWYIPVPPEAKFELHAFSDASIEFIGACVYLRAAYDGMHQCALVYAKCRVIPSKEVANFSIARKELLALVMAADLLGQCKQAMTLKILKSELWTDNTTVIKWCSCNSKELLVFVRNRVDKILSESGGATPRYVESSMNPADIASRGFSHKIKEEVELWKRGAPFLWKPEEEWDVKDTSYTKEELLSDPLVTVEIRPTETHGVLGVKETDDSMDRSLLQQLDCDGTVVEVETKLVVLKYCLRAWSTYAKRSRGDADVTPEDSEVARDWQNDLDERRKSRLLLVKWSQREDMTPLIKLMEKGLTYEEAYSNLPAAQRARWMSEIRKYVPFLDKNGILRMGGRLEHAELSFSHRHPAFLPRRHWITKMYIKAKHEDLLHMGKDTVFASLQQDWGLWPVSNTNTVGHYLIGCEGCKLNKQVRGAQLMSTLPRERVFARSHVFESVSIDYAGPFQVVAGRGTIKRYLCVFVCMSTTAMRLIMVRDLTSSFFLSALRRFLSSSGYVTKLIRSDNGTNFIGAANILKKEVMAALAKVNASAELKDALSRWSIKWQFGPPESSHHGGVYERQIRTIRKILLSVPELINRNPTEDELQTSFADAEYVMNCRPLTKSPSSDGLPPLRPRDLMVGVLDPVNVCGPPALSDPGDVLRRGHLRTRRISELWWDRWIAEYLPSMQQRSKWLVRTRNFSVGDLVLICDEKCPGYLKYPYAIIIDTKLDNDGNVRSVTARMSDGTLRTRDIRKLALIDAVEGRTCP